MTYKPILSLDFDGVIHSYTSGWKGARIVADPPVDGALDFMTQAMESFRVAVFSSRSHAWGGRRAMKWWLRTHAGAEILRLVEDDGVESWRAKDKSDGILYWWHEACTNTIEPFEHVVDDAARRFVKAVEWPLFKPAASVGLDDRVKTFTGVWPSMENLRSFKPWNKR